MSNADIYHEMIIDYSRNPINYGKIEDHDVTFHDSNPLCGDSIDIDMKIDDNKVSDIKFHGKGCAICMACSSVLTEIAKGKNIDEVRNISKTDVLGELGLENLQQGVNGFCGEYFHLKFLDLHTMSQIYSIYKCESSYLSNFYS